MPRITIRNKIFFGLVVTAVLSAGCSGDYKQKRLGDDSPQARQVRAMIDSLRRAGLDGLDETMSQQAAKGLDQRQKDGLQATLAEIIEAEKVEPQGLERFGKSVYRVALDLTEDGQRRKVFILLVESEDNLRWAGRN